MTSLQQLDLDRTRVTDAGMHYIGALSALKSLHLGPQITDEGLQRLQDLPSLSTLTSFGTGVTPEGLAPFKGYSADAPKVGVMFSHFTATAQLAKGLTAVNPHRRSHSYFAPEIVTRELRQSGFNVYAVVEPGTENLGALPSILEDSALSDRIINGGDATALGQLDVIVFWLTYGMVQEVADGVSQAIRAGLGCVRHGSAGNRFEGKNVAMAALTGMDNGEYFWGGNHTEYLCAVLEPHPILGDLEVGDVVAVETLDGFTGIHWGRALLSSPDGTGSDFCPLYVHEVGAGRVVSCQWLELPRVGPDAGPEEFISSRMNWRVEFLNRCLNWAARRPVDAQW